MQIQELASAVPMIWDLMFEQTPVVIRWLLGVMLVAIASLIGIVYRRLRADVKRLHHRIDGVEGRVDAEIRELNTSMLMIAHNARNKRDNRR